jgi:hypothetical protein
VKTGRAGHPARKESHQARAGYASSTCPEYSTLERCELPFPCEPLNQSAWRSTATDRYERRHNRAELLLLS